MVDDYNTTIMEVFEQTKDVPLSLANPIRIPPRSVVVALVECNRPLHPHMDIKGDLKPRRVQRYSAYILYCFIL